MNILDQLRDLQSLLINENKLEVEYKNTRDKTDEVIKIEKPVYTDYKTYYRMTVNLKKTLLVLSMVASIIFILFVGLPKYFERFPAQNAYVYYGIPGLVFIILCVMMVIRSNIKNYEELDKFYLIDYVKMKYEHIAIPIGLSLLLFIIGIGFFAATAIVEVSDAYLIKVEEVMNIAVLNAVICAGFMVGVEIALIALIPLKKAIIKFMPRFRKERKSIDNYENKEASKYDNNIAYYKIQLNDVRKKIKSNRVISYKFKTIEFVRKLIKFIEANPNAPYRYALNYVVINNQIRYYQDMIKMQEEIADLKIKNSFAELEVADIEYRATINTYNKLLSENRMRESYINQQGKDEVKKYIDRHTK